jgi:hypothetical protein
MADAPTRDELLARPIGRVRCDCGCKYWSLRTEWPGHPWACVDCAQWISQVIDRQEEING